MKNNPEFDRVNSDLNYLRFDKRHFIKMDDELMLFFIYLFSENLLEKYLMNKYEKSLKKTKLDPRKELKCDKNLDVLKSFISNIDNINLEYNTCSDSELKKIINNLSEKNNCSFQKIFEAFEWEVDRLGYKVIIKILYFFKYIEYAHKGIHKGNFLADIYERNLLTNYYYRGSRYDYVSQTDEITRFMISQVGSIENLKVYNPFAGSCSFINEIDDSNTIFAQELNPKTWAIGQLRLLFNKSSATFNCEDSIKKWPKNKKFDLIVSFPPFGMKLRSSEYRFAENFILNKSIESLSKKGKAIFILPISILWSSGSLRRIRERLVNEDLIETIIYFPPGVLHLRNFPFIVMKLNKLKKDRNEIILVDSEPYTTNNGHSKSFIELNEKKISEAINVLDKTTVRKISTEEIIKNNYFLNLPRYFQGELNEGIKLKEILTVYRVNVERDRRMKNDYALEIKPKDLKNDSLNFNLNIDEIEPDIINFSNVKIINTSCLLLSLKSTNLNPTYFNFIDKPIYLNKNITPFIIKEDKYKVNLSYLINELHSPYVKEQLKRFKIGTFIPFIRINDFLEVKIKLPSMEEQNAKVSGIQELSNEIKLRQKKIEDLQAGIDSETYGNVSSVFHSLGTPLTNIYSGLLNIKNALSNNVSKWKEIKISKISNTSLEDSFSTIQSELEFISSTLEKNKTNWDCSNYKLDEENLITIIKDYIKTNNSLQKKNISTTLEINEDIKNELSNKVLINTNKDLLKKAFNSIVENAQRHAFIDPKKNYKLKFKISLINEVIEDDKGIEEEIPHVKIEVANNGKTFPDNFTVDDLIRRNFSASNTGNTGQGGYILNEIIKYHNKGRSLLYLDTDNPNSEYKTTYFFLIPLNL